MLERYERSVSIYLHFICNQSILVETLSWNRATPCVVNSVEENSKESGFHFRASQSTSPQNQHMVKL